MLTHLYLLPLLCLGAAICIFFLGRWLPGKGSTLGILVAGWGFVHSLYLLIQAAGHRLVLPYEASLNWFSFGLFQADLGVYVDGMTLVMLVVVTLVSLLVQIYSIGYMHEDPRFKRYYAYLSLFTASMLGLVVANNMLLFFISWELVGVCSYLLIGFWFEKPEAAYAGKKAFITTKFGDLGLFIGILLLFSATGTFRFSQLQTQVQSGYLSSGIATWIALLLFCGAVGKSAQFPLLVWLPDAMEGPTPVSALIHAATMVAAGVYLVARLYFVYWIAPLALETVAWVGLLTAFLAATMALVAYDIKRVLAFSTISQLGYMMLGLGVGGYTAGMFHLTTHAFFKALLFLGAGSVIHSVHTNDIRQMGGLSKKMPITFLTFLAATASIAGLGIPKLGGLAGFYSKEEILAATLHHSVFMFSVAAFTAGMTAFYMARLFCLTFLGDPRDQQKFVHAQESPRTMTIPLIVLAVPSIGAGWFFARKNLFESLVHFEQPSFQGAEILTHGQLGMLSVALAGTAIGLAYYMYLKVPEVPEKIKSRLGLVVNLLGKRYGLDAFYLWVVDGVDRFSQVLFWFDFHVVDSFFVDGWGRLTLLCSVVNNWFDRVVVDGLVDLSGRVTSWFGRRVPRWQTGFVQNYLLWIAVGVSAFGWVVFWK